jgi:GT2 family glycosyltransferase
MENNLLITLYTYNRPEYVACNLMSLHCQTYRFFDILIVDDAGDVNVQEHPMVANVVFRLEAEGHKVSFHRMKVNGGIGKARKEATANIKHKFCFDLNDDHFLEPDCLALMMATILKDSKIGCVGSCTPMVFWDDDKRIRKFDAYKSKLNKIFKNPNNGSPEFNRGVDYVYVDKKGSIITSPVKVDHCSQFIYRTGIVPVADLPSEYSRIGFTEETDFSLRFRKAGYKLMFQPNAINWHMLSPKGGIRAISPLDRMDVCKDDWGVFINNWGLWLNEKNNP